MLHLMGDNSAVERLSQNQRVILIFKPPSLAEAMYNNGYPPVAHAGALPATLYASCNFSDLNRWYLQNKKDPSNEASKRKLYTLKKR